MNKLKYLFFISFFVSSCAQISAPTGGERDNNPPKLKIENPANKTLNFSGKEIKLTFNEWIQPLTNVKNQVIISPNVEPYPKIEIERNQLVIKFKENTLQPNTTYSLYFGDNIKDNNEGNPFSNYKYLFSTGSFIDSLKVGGKIAPTDGKIDDNTYLLLYKDLSDTAFTKTRPFYITKIDNSGNFNLENVKEEKYAAYTLTDKNGNYYYDLPTEKIGFLDSAFDLKSNIDTLHITHFLPEPEKYRIVSTEKNIKGGMLNIELNKEFSPIKDEFRAENKEDTTMQILCFPQENGKTLKICFPKMQKDSGNFTLKLFINDKLYDSLPVRIESTKWKIPQLFFTDTTAYKNLKVFEGKKLELKTSFYSTIKPDISKISITDSVKNAIPFEIRYKEDLSTLEIGTDWKNGMNYNINIFDSALVDILGNYNKKQNFSVLGVSVKKGGNLLINIELPHNLNDFVAILSDNSGKVWDRRFLGNSQALKIDYGLLPAGTYSLKVIDDKNNNGIENSGSFTEKTLPEKTFVSKPITIKENWDAEEKIIVDFTSAAIVPQVSKNEGVGEKESEGIKDRNDIINKNFKSDQQKFPEKN